MPEGTLAQPAGIGPSRLLPSHLMDCSRGAAMRVFNSDKSRQIHLDLPRQVVDPHLICRGRGAARTVFGQRRHAALCGQKAQQYRPASLPCVKSGPRARQSQYWSPALKSACKKGASRNLPAVTMKCIAMLRSDHARCSAVQ